MSPPSSLRESLEKKLPGYEAPSGTRGNERAPVKDHIVRAYDLSQAAKTLTYLLSNVENVNYIVKQSFQTNIDSYRSEIKEIIETPVDLLSAWEASLLEIVKYQIEHDAPSIAKIETDKKLSSWLQRQRLRGSAYLDDNRKELSGAALQLVKHDTELLHKLQVPFTLDKPKRFDDYMEELRVFQAANGHVKVRRLQDQGNLGEWVHKMRREKDLFEEGKQVPNLNDERIAELDTMGFVWKVRHGRPKKGDARFRLRRKSNENETNTHLSGDDNA